MRVSRLTVIHIISACSHTTHTQISAFSKALGDTRSLADKRKLLLSVPTINKSTSDDEDDDKQPAKRPKQAVSSVVLLCSVPECG